MIRTLLYFYIIIITITSGLILTGDLKAFGAFENLSSAINQVYPVGATGDFSGITSSASVNSSNDTPNYPDPVKLTINVFLFIIKIFAFFIVGAIEIIDLVDPTHSWALIIIAPFAVIQAAAFFFILIELAGTLLGSR